MNDDMILRDAREMNPTLHPRVHVDGIGKGDDPIATQMKTISVGLMNMNHSEKNVRQSRSDGLPSSSSSSYSAAIACMSCSEPSSSSVNSSCEVVARTVSCFFFGQLDAK